MQKLNLDAMNISSDINCLANAYVFADEIVVLELPRFHSGYPFNKVPATSIVVIDRAAIYSNFTGNCIIVHNGSISLSARIAEFQGAAEEAGMKPETHVMGTFAQYSCLSLPNKALTAIIPLLTKLETTWNLEDQQAYAKREAQQADQKNLQQAEELARQFLTCRSEITDAALASADERTLITNTFLAMLKRNLIPSDPK